MFTFTPTEGRVILTDFTQPQSLKAPAESAHILRELADIKRNLDGTPHFRVSFGECTVKTRGGEQYLAYRKKLPKQIQVAWMQGNNRYPMSVDTKLLPKDIPLYPVNKIIWEGLPCWVLEEWESPEVLAAEWEPRYKWDDRAGKVVDWMGPPPQAGCYRAVAYLHDGNWGYAPLPASLPNVVRGLLAAAERSRVENPYLENTPELIAARTSAINNQLNQQEEDKLNALAEEFVEALIHHPKLIDDLQTSLHSEIEFHKKRENRRANAAK
jgi:hypothetical protein